MTTAARGSAADARVWLPLGAAAHAAVQAAIGSAVAAWSERWFAKRRVMVLSYTPTPAAGASLEPMGWRIFPGGVAISPSRTTTARLLGWALDVAYEQTLLTETDRELVRMFEAKAVEDLVLTLQAALGMEPTVEGAGSADQPFAELGGLLLMLGSEEGIPLMAAGLPLERLAKLCRSRVGRRATTSAPPQDRIAALARVPIRLEAELGRVELSLADLAGLAVGDVLVLDAAVEGGEGITLSSGGKRFAHAALTDLNGRPAVVVTP
jgi:flagellar motor switch/type III secretory pathway protein FliN